MWLGALGETLYQCNFLVNNAPKAPKLQAQEPHALDSPALSNGALWDEVWAGWVGGSLTDW